MKQIAILIALLSLTIMNVLGQSCTDIKEYYRQRHQLGGVYGSPYSMFDRHSGLSLDSMIANIRRRLIIGDPNDNVVKAYNNIYINAMEDRPTDDGMSNAAVSSLALWSKNNAFVFLIGFDRFGSFIDAGPSGNSIRNEFQTRALSGFEHLTGEIDSKEPGWGWWFTGPIGYYIVNVSNEQKFLTKIKLHSRSLTLWLQTYDLLKAANQVSDLNGRCHYTSNTDGDRNQSNCSPRNKLRKLTRDLYYYSEGKMGVIEHAWGWKKNHGIAAASTLVLAAQVLNDAGVETRPVVGTLSWVFGRGPFPHPKYSPVNWYEVGSNGLNENLFEGNHWWPAEDVPQSPINTSEKSYSVYAEGPGYTQYGLLDNGIPAMRSQANFMPGGAENAFLNQNEIKNIFNWYENIKLQDGQIPSYDNTADNLKCNVLSLTGNPVFNRDNLGGLNNLNADYVALVGGTNIPINNSFRKSIDNMPNSGNMILRIQDKDSSNHYVMMLAESGLAVDKAATFVDDTHDDNDFASFVIAADGDWLAIDPGYLGSSVAYRTNKYEHHNVIQMVGSANSYEYHLTKIGKPYFNSVLPIGNSNKLKQSFNLDVKIKDFGLGFNLNQWPPITLINDTGYVRRNVNQYKTEGVVYYVLNDYIKAPSDSDDILWNINGNGNTVDTFVISQPSLGKTFVRDATDSRIFKWRHPCSTRGLAAGGKWSLLTHSAVLSGNNYPLDTLITYSDNQSGYGTIHGSGGNHVTNSKGIAPDGGHSEYGVHTRLTLIQNRSKTIFQTILIPYKCNQEENLPQISRIENDTHVVSLIQFPSQIDTSISSWKDLGKNNSGSSVMDSITHIHYTRWDIGINDTFNSMIGEISTDAAKFFIQHNKISWAKFGACTPSHTNIRNVNLEFGTYLNIGDQQYLLADNPVQFNYYFVGKYKYDGFVQNVGNADSIEIYLPDVPSSVTDMKIFYKSQPGLGSRYNPTTKILKAKLPSDSASFRIKQADPCIDCYFPSTSETIDSTFNFNVGSTRNLGHNLDIVQPKGFLNITENSNLNITCGKYLRNKDSIILTGPCQSEFAYNPCEGIDTNFVDTYKSGIIIDNGSALVLDSGSYTYIGNNTGIYVRSGGTLVIKDNSFIRIGNNDICGRGEIIAEPGSYVHIEKGAHIEFNKQVGDTIDKHYFYLSLFPSWKISFPGVSPSIESSLLTDSIILPSYTVTDFCSLNDSMLPAVHHNEWGYANFMAPKPDLRLRNDTICSGEKMYISLRRFLNDNQYKFKVCRVDSLYLPDKNGNYSWVDTCLVDTMSYDTIMPDPDCIPPHAAPDEFTYLFKTNSLHRVTMEVTSDCGIKKDTTVFVFVTEEPAFTMNVPEIACSGVGSVIATTSNDLTGWYEWYVQLLDTSQLPIIYDSKQNNLLYFSHSDYGLIPDSFSFNDFNFLGGRKYLVSLCVKNSCGSFCIDDTVNIPAGAYIKLTKPTVYAQPVNGATSIQLNGYVSLSDSFRWEPTTYLDNSTILNPISTPTDSITYVLISHSGECVSTDTTFIKYNHVANAGINDTLCYDSNYFSTDRMLGFPYDMSLFLGMLYYYDNTEFMNHYNAHNQTNNPEYFRYFTHYMHYITYHDQTTSCHVDLYNIITNQLTKELFFSKDWYPQYYRDFVEFDDNSLPSLSDFKSSVINDQQLKDHLDSLMSWTNIVNCVDGIFLEYDNYLTNYSNDITTNWTKITDIDTSNLSNWENYFVITDSPIKTTKYILSVITPDYAEIDEVNLVVDTALLPLFNIDFQYDSSVYFSNISTFINSATVFSWNFGDGSPVSSDFAPIHTFPAFDSSYVVCLSATNKCGTWTYCDTVFIDSLHLNSALSVSKNNDLNQSEMDAQINTSKQKGINPANQKIQLQNYPNPLNEYTIIEYQIWQEFNNAELVITDVYGRKVFNENLTRPWNKIKVDGSLLPDGYYYYSIIINGNYRITKPMVVIH